MLDNVPPIKDLDNIPVEVVRKAYEAFIDGGGNMAKATKALGYPPDGKRLRRDLGLMPVGVKSKDLRTHVPYETAVHMIKSWRLDPVDYGV